MKLINNFCGREPVKLIAHSDNYGPYVSIIQSGGSMSFQHTMTPTQAREMAAALVALADSFDEVTA